MQIEKTSELPLEKQRGIGVQKKEENPGVFKHFF